MHGCVDLTAFGARHERDALNRPRLAAAASSLVRGDFGALWSKTSTEGRNYLGFKLDGPRFTASLDTNLFDDGDEGYGLIYSRPGRRNGA
ncbi:DUF736 family protein [Hoeflea prorocentri]|uniref:DUF736 family protein n=1 Tax=Hoeflea prorocentri TaxID=1922333 RepID=A0A9X3UNK8_9HYPH|nr:DUF736 family protein [Hoeflea prorocentri]MCY6383690.1 DUF736 family protein [Hoeflea prorocentri]MDA5401490.1 DUF736 family protein [Hoeflea prorocentri]